MDHAARAAELAIERDKHTAGGNRAAAAHAADLYAMHGQLAALIEERRGYVMHGKEDRAAAVDKQIAAWRGLLVKLGEDPDAGDDSAGPAEQAAQERADAGEPAEQEPRGRTRSAKRTA